MQYLVVIERGARTFGAYVPDLPGCIATAESEDAVSQLIQEAIELHIEALREGGEPVPPPSSTSKVVQVGTA
jgi:predicted RNase H-like HicB family nuclease